jgi:hypothetical protein
MSKREKRENAKTRNAKYAETRNPRDMRVREIQTVWDREMRAMCEMRENARNLKREIREMHGNAKHAKTRNAKCKMQNARYIENAKIAEVATLQQVQ